MKSGAVATVRVFGEVFGQQGQEGVPLYCVPDFWEVRGAEFRGYLFVAYGETRCGALGQKLAYVKEYFGRQIGETQVVQLEDFVGSAGRWLSHSSFPILEVFRRHVVGHLEKSLRKPGASGMDWR